MTPGPGIEPGPHWWEASALTTAPSLFPASFLELCSSKWQDTLVGRYSTPTPTLGPPTPAPYRRMMLPIHAPADQGQ